MIVLTDNCAYAERVIDPKTGWTKSNFSNFHSDPALKEIAGKVYPKGIFYKTKIDLGGAWSIAFISMRAFISHYDLMKEAGRKKNYLPNGLIFIAGESDFCHGQRGRTWTALSGNLHLTVFLTPKCRIAHFGTGFSLLAAVSVVETIDGFKGLKGKAAIKWVNDINIGKAKIAGFLAHSHSIGNEIESAILGIGMNVETNPNIEGDVFISETIALSELVTDEEKGILGKVFRNLLLRLHVNYNLLLAGKYKHLLSFYRARSSVLGRKVHIFSDPEDGECSLIAAGTVDRIGNNLELYLEGQKDPVTRGRLVLG
jgi:BirA family biotin operon repressor/biotin-[acetyl-CoA-carboxylase] ligase